MVILASSKLFKNVLKAKQFVQSWRARKGWGKDSNTVSSRIHIFKHVLALKGKYLKIKNNKTNPLVYQDTTISNLHKLTNPQNHLRKYHYSPNPFYRLGNRFREIRDLCKIILYGRMIIKWPQFSSIHNPWKWHYGSSHKAKLISPHLQSCLASWFALANKHGRVTCQFDV